MSGRARRVLGIDTSLRCPGVGVVEAEGSRMRALEYGCLRMGAGLKRSECLRRASQGVRDLLLRWHPDAAVVEGAFFCRNAATAMALGEARGAVIAACAAEGVPVYEYAPRRLKQSVVGFGAASKEQVRAMVRRLLSLDGDPQEDAADALALAICHLHGVRRVAARPAEPI